MESAQPAVTNPMTTTPVSEMLPPADAPDARPGTRDHEYNVRLWAPDYAQTLAGFRARGAAVRQGQGAQLDLRWGRLERQTVDLFLPQQDSGGLLVFLHGGYWQYRTSGKDGVSFLAPTFLEQGCAFAAIQYALCPDVDMDGMVDQVRDALDWVWQRLPAHGYRPRRTVVAGHSAGAHLAMMMASTDWRARGHASCPLHGAFGLSGLYTLGPLMSTYLNRDLRISDANAVRNSPQSLVNANLPQVLLGVGALESPAFQRQTGDYRDALQRAGVPVRSWMVAGKGHFNVLETLVQPDHPMARSLAALCAGPKGAGA
jgi:arylformamidase